MKLSWGFTVSSLLCAVSAREALVYTLDETPNSSPQAPSSVDPETARLILARRLGLSPFHSIENPSEQAIQQLNAFGGAPTKLFAQKPPRSNAHVLIWMEDVEHATEITKHLTRWTSRFTIPNPPAATDNERLLQDFILQAGALSKEEGPFETTFSDNKIKPNEWLSIVRRNAKTENYAMDDLAAMIKDLASYTRAGEETPYWSVTLVLMPPSAAHSKRAAQPYGTYERPSNLERRRELSEAPLSLASAKASNFPVPDLEDFPVITQAEGNDTSAPLGILKTCYSSQSACEKTTHSCSGHGQCKLLHKGDKDKQRTDCYGCACTPSVKHYDGKGMESYNSTTYWGGPACQKQDVSVAFWLFVIVGVLLAFLISSSIGMLYSMGSEELPSVIGAGVSGPSRK